MTMTDAIQEYIQAREEEELVLQMHLSRKRKLLFEQAFVHDLAESSQSAKIARKTRDLVAVLHRKAEAAHPQYSSLGMLEKAICYLAYNSVIALSEDTANYIDVDDSEFSVFQAENQYGSVEVTDNDAMAVNVTTHMKLHLNPEDRFLESLKLIPLASTPYERQIYRIYSLKLEQHAYRQDEVHNWRNMTEIDVIDRFYTPIFNIIFENSPLHYRLGESENNESKEAAKVRELCEGHSAFKVDMRLVLQYFDSKKHTLYDLANVEFAKSGDISRKNISDGAKVMLEGKCIIDQLVRVCKLDWKRAQKLRVINMQVCGMKATLFGIQLESKGRGYVSHQIGKTLRFPTSPKHLPVFIKDVLPHLYLLKETAEVNAEILQHELNYDTSKYGDQSPDIVRSFIKETWPGPKQSSHAPVPALPASFLSS